MSSCTRTAAQKYVRLNQLKCSVPSGVNHALPLQINVAVTKENPERLDIYTGKKNLCNLYNPFVIQQIDIGL